MNAFVSTALRGACPTVFAALVAAASLGPTSVWAGDPSPAPTEAKAAVGTATTPATSETSTSGDKWRFVWHNNQWWYYKPNGQWLIHDGSNWQPQEAFAVDNSRVTGSYQPATGSNQPAYRSNRSNNGGAYYRPFNSNQRGTGDPLDAYGFWGNAPRYWTYQHVLRGK
jgi:hypothetical protein